MNEPDPTPRRLTSRRVAGLALIGLGVAGLALPLVPGWLLIGAGVGLRRRQAVAALPAR